MRNLIAYLFSEVRLCKIMLADGFLSKIIFFLEHAGELRIIIY